MYVGMITAGRNVEEACAAVGVSRPTVSRWLARGRAGKDVEAVEFARAVDEANFAPLTESDLVRLLEKSALKGSIRAIDLLLRRPWESAHDRRHRHEDAFAELDERDVIGNLRRRREKRLAEVREGTIERLAREAAERRPTPNEGGPNGRY